MILHPSSYLISYKKQGCQAAASSASSRSKPQFRALFLNQCRNRGLLSFATDLRVQNTSRYPVTTMEASAAQEIVCGDDSNGEQIEVPDTEPVVGVDVTTDQLSPHDLWVWNSQTHWKHWHGIWTLYQPLESPKIVKENRSIRSLWPVDKDRIHLYHRNQWFSMNVEASDVGWEFGPWAMFEKKHSLPDGIWHPNSLDHRILQFPNGDLGWVQLALKPNDPKCVIFNELHFMASPDARMPVVVGYDSVGKLGVALMLEERRESDEPPEGSWKGTIWRHHSDPIDESRDEPEGTYIGTEMELTTTLSRTTRQAKWKGFKGGILDPLSTYTLVHLPNHVTVFTPKVALVGKPHSYFVSWVVDHSQVRVLSASYFADGRLQYVKSGIYNKVVEPS